MLLEPTSDHVGRGGASPVAESRLRSTGRRTPSCGHVFEGKRDSSGFSGSLWPVPQNGPVPTVLIELPDGEGVIRRDDGEIVVTQDVSDDRGQPLREGDQYQPVKTWLDDDRSLVGGLLPPGAVSAEVIDDRGTRVTAKIGGGAYAAIIEQPNDGHEPVVCCREPDGTPVRRPLPDDYPCAPVEDVEEPCPACGAVDYDECVPTESWRGGRSGPDGTTIPNPIVVCRVCGHEEGEGTFFGAVSSDDTEDEATREARIARARAHMRTQRWYSNTMTLRAVTFPIYAAERWPALIGGSGSRGDQLTSLTIRHYDTPGADPYAGDRPRLEITTSNDDPHRGGELREARWTLNSWLHNDGTHSLWPKASHAAIIVWLRARDREMRAKVLAAIRSEQLITVDGTAQPFLTLTTHSSRWVAVHRHDDLTITIAAHDLDPTTLTLESIPDPAARLLGPEPKDP
jgi:hypothetical protein